MRERHIELPPLESLPHTTCVLCHRSLICGLFTPYELAREDRSPRCRKCCGDVSEKQRQNKGAWRNIVSEYPTLKGKVQLPHAPTIE